MFKKYDHTNLIFSAGSRVFKVLNLVSEHSCRTIPNHTHGESSYEIHYICDGGGRARIAGQDYELSPGVLYVVGPSIEHAQSPYPEDHMREYCIHLHMQKKTQARMSAASMMLINSSDSISKIAEDVGYSSIEHFSAAFKKYYGTAPTQYRKSFQK